MRHSTKAGYAAIAEILSEPLATIDVVEAILEGVCVTVADNGCSMFLPGDLGEYLKAIEQRRI